jgi:transcriptional regulator with XRE-family HTH domain
MKRTIDLDTYRQEMLKNPEYRREYFKHDLKFEIAEMLLEARAWKGITQVELARLIKTKQAGIARAERGKHLPSLSFLDKIAKAIGTYLTVRFGFMEEYEVNYSYKASYTKHEDAIISTNLIPLIARVNLNQPSCLFNHERSFKGGAEL